MSAQHTPGKWTVGYGAVLGEQGEFFGVGLPGNPWKPICLLSRAEAVTPEDEANAQLIADAPAFYALDTQTTQERDSFHQAADDLAHAIAAHLGIAIGEHSNLNCPWTVALDALRNAANAHAMPVSAAEPAAGPCKRCKGSGLVPDGEGGDMACEACGGDGIEPREYHTGDDDLDMLLGLTDDIVSGRGNHDVAMLWMSRLDAVKARLAPVSAQALPAQAGGGGMSGQHTPGPWSVGGKYSFKTVLLNARGESIASGGNNRSVQGAELEASLILASAAPELLHELRLLNLDANGEQRRNTPAWRAIAKATGAAA